MVIIHAQSGVILEKAGLLPSKGFLMFETITNIYIFLNILTNDMLKEIDSVKYELFSFNIFIRSFKLVNPYFDVIFSPWCFDVMFEFHNSVLIQMLIS